MPQFSFLAKHDSSIDSERFRIILQIYMSIYPVFISNSLLKNVYPFEFDWKAMRIGENIFLRTSRRFHLFWSQTHLCMRLFFERVHIFAWYFTHTSIVIDHIMNFTASDLWLLIILIDTTRLLLQCYSTVCESVLPYFTFKSEASSTKFCMIKLIEAH